MTEPGYRTPQATDNPAAQAASAEFLAAVDRLGRAFGNMAFALRVSFETISPRLQRILDTISEETDGLVGDVENPSAGGIDNAQQRALSSGDTPQEEPPAMAFTYTFVTDRDNRLLAITTRTQARDVADLVVIAQVWDCSDMEAWHPVARGRHRNVRYAVLRLLADLYANDRNAHLASEGFLAELFRHELNSALPAPACTVVHRSDVSEMDDETFSRTVVAHRARLFLSQFEGHQTLEALGVQVRPFTAEPGGVDAVPGEGDSVSVYVRPRRKMRLYLASNYKRREQMEEYAEALRERGIDVISRWHGPQGIPAPEDPENEAGWRAIATQDLADIMRAQRVMVFTDEPDGETGGYHTTGGHHVEFGMALCMSRMPNWPSAKTRHYPPIVVGPRIGVFHYLSEVYPSFDAYVGVLDALREKKEG